MLKKFGLKEKYILYESVYNLINDFIVRNGKSKNSYVKFIIYY